ncbi:MAG: NusG domain II-containing protein [Peptococcaceae bacterium]|nr:NusG domain II-containing protein [Peptococcaceae bacterium]
MKKRLLIILLVLVVICGGAGFYWWNSRGADETIATVEVDGEVRYTFHLDEITDTKTYEIKQADGAENTIKVSPEGIAVTHANCPDQVCVKQGFHKHGPQPIVCLPHKVSIRFASADGGTSGDLDAMTGQ